MNDNVRRMLPPGCREARERIHAMLDADGGRATRHAEAEDHLERCAECREFRDDLVRLQGSLRELPLIPMPEAVLDRIREQTRRERPGSSGRAAPLRWPLAAAAMLTLALAGLWWVSERPESIEPIVPTTASAQPTDEEIEQAAEDFRLVLGVMSHALQEAEQSAGRVIRENVTPALNRVPVVGGKPNRERRSSGRSQGVQS